MEYKFLLNKADSIFQKFIQIYLEEEDLDFVLDGLLKLYKVLDFHYQAILITVFSFPFTKPNSNSIEENKRKFVEYLNGIAFISCDKLWYRLYNKIAGENNVFLNSKILLYLYIYSNKQKPEYLYIFTPKDLLSEMIRLNSFKYKKEFSLFITDIILLRRTEFLQPEIHNLIAYFLSNIHLVNYLFEKYSIKDNNFTSNLIFNRIIYLFYKRRSLNNISEKVFDTEILKDINISKKQSKKSFNADQELKECFKIYFNHHEIEEKIIQKYLNPNFSFFNDFIVLSCIKYNDLKFFSFEEEKSDFMYNFVLNHNLVYQNLPINLKCDLDSILQCIQKVKQLDFNIINTFFKDCNNIIAFVYKYNLNNDFMFNYQVINMVCTINLFEYFENNLEKTPPNYIKQTRFILVDKLLQDVIEKTLNQNIETVNFIYHLQFIVSILSSEDYFERTHDKVINLLQIQFDIEFQQRTIEAVKLAILFHNFISMYIISCKTLNQMPKCDLILKFIYEQSFTYFQTLIDSDLQVLNLKNYLNSFLTIIVNIIEVSNLKCFNLLCVRCMKIEIDENYLLYQDSKIFICRGCYCSNIYAWVPNPVFNRENYVQIINQEINNLKNLFNAISEIINKSKDQEYQFVYYYKLSEFLKQILIYSNTYQLSDSVYEIYNKLHDEIEKYLSNLSIEFKCRKEFMTFPYIPKIQQKKNNLKDF